MCLATISVFSLSMREAKVDVTPVGGDTEAALSVLESAQVPYILGVCMCCCIYTT